jgi:hypothetical protein
VHRLPQKQTAQFRDELKSEEVGSKKHHVSNAVGFDAGLGMREN